MRRIMMLLAVVALMVVMLAMSVAPAFAANRNVGLCIRIATQIGFSHQDAAHTCTGKP
jgi:hypothetical protein